MIDRQQLDRLPGKHVIGSDGKAIGTIDEVYVDNDTGEPSFVLVDTGLLGLKSSFVPLDRADLVGGDLKVAATKDQVKDAPGLEADGYLSPNEEDELYHYYGLQSPSERQVSAAQADEGTSGSVGTERAAAAEHGTVGRDTSGRTTDDAMTRSEEELRVGIRKKEVGKARLRKHVITEHVTKTIPVQREVVTIDREPVDESNIEQATEGPALSEDEHEVTLYEEEVVVEKRVVPKERVRLTKEIHTEEETVEADVAKETIDLKGLEESRQEDGR
jgi:uncharacterized protein (TIGR02271 family)